MNHIQNICNSIQLNRNLAVGIATGTAIGLVALSIFSLSHNVVQVHNEGTNMNNSVRNALPTIEQLKQANKNLTDKESKLTTEITTLYGKNEQLIEEKNKLLSENQDTKHQLFDAQKNIGTQNQTIAELKSKVYTLETEATHLRGVQGLFVKQEEKFTSLKRENTLDDQMKVIR